MFKWELFSVSYFIFRIQKTTETKQMSLSSSLFIFGHLKI